MKKLILAVILAASSASAFAALGDSGMEQSLVKFHDASIQAFGKDAGEKIAEHIAKSVKVNVDNAVANQLDVNCFIVGSDNKRAVKEAMQNGNIPGVKEALAAGKGEALTKMLRSIDSAATFYCYSKINK